MGLFCRRVMAQAHFLFDNGYTKVVYLLRLTCKERYNMKNPGNDIVIQVLREADGNLTCAAKALKIDRSTIHRWVEASDELKEALKSIRESWIDQAEGLLQAHCKEGNMTALIFFLKTQAKSRGYVERTELSHEGSMHLKMYGESGLTEEV